MAFLIDGTVIGEGDDPFASMMGAMKDAGRKDAMDRIEKAAADVPAGALSVEGYDGEMLAFGYDAAHDAGWRTLDPDEVQDAGEVYFAPGFGAEKKTSYRYSAHAVSMNGDADLEFEAEIVSDKPLSLEEIYERMWEKVPAAYGLPKDRKQAMKDFKVTMTDLMKKADAAKRSGDGDTMTALQDELRKHPFPQIDQLTYGEGPGEATIRLAQNPGEFDALTKQGVPAAAFSPKPDPEFEKALRANGMKPEDFPLPPPGYAETAEMRFNAPASDVLMARRVIANEGLSIGKDLLGRPYLKEGEGSAFVVNVESAEFEKDWAQYSALISRGETESEVAYQYADDLKAAEEIDFPVRLEVSAESGEEDDEAVARCLREKYGLQLVRVADVEWNQDLDESAAVRPGKDTISVTQLLRELRSFPDKGAKLAYIVNVEGRDEPADGSGEWVKTLDLVYDSDSYAKIVIGWTPDERDAMTVGAFSVKLSAVKDRRVAIEVQDKGGSFNVVQAEVRNGPGFAGIVFDCGAPVARKALNEIDSSVKTFIDFVISALNLNESEDRAGLKHELIALSDRLRSPADLDRYFEEHRDEIQAILDRTQKHGKAYKFFASACRALWAVAKTAVPFAISNWGSFLKLAILVHVCIKFGLNPIELADKVIDGAIEIYDHVFGDAAP